MDAHDPSSSSTIERLFDEFLDRLEAGGAPRFEDFAAEHAPHEADLWQLYERWCRADATIEALLPAATGSSLLVEPPDLDGPRDGEPSAPAGMHPGRVLGDFRLVRRLGRGGMGEVWEAEQLSLRRRVALKLLRTDRRGGGAARWLTLEARAGGRVSHERIVAIHAVGEADGVAFIAEQLVPGGLTLADVLARLADRPRLPAAWYRRIAHLFADVADALHAAHEAGVLHRDLKPSNILIAPDGRALISDFGLASLADEEPGQERVGMVGTLAYMSPEQALARHESVDRRSDVFSLGAVLYEALTLRRAFEGDDARVVLQRVLHEDPPDPVTLRSGVPRDLALICGKALRKLRGDRYASMAELAADLRRHLADQPILARPEGPLPRAAKWSRRHPVWTTAGALVSAALLVISVLLVREVELRRLASEHAREALRQSYLANIRAAALSLQRGDDEDGQRRLLACPPEQRGWEWRHLWLAADQTLLTLAGTAGPVEAVAASRDGRRLITGCSDGSVHVWDGETGSPLSAFTGHMGAVLSVAIADDLRTVVSGSEDGTVRVWDVASGGSIAVLRGHEGPVRSVDISGDGWRIVSGSDDGTARVWDGRQGNDFAVLPNGNVGFVSVSITSDGKRMVTGSRYGSVKLWDADTGESLLQITSYERADVRAAISGDGARIVSGDADGTLHVWAAADGAELASLQAHAGPVTALSVSDDGSLVASACADTGVVTLWPVGEASTRRLAGQCGRILSLALSRDGTRVISGSSDASARLWDTVPAGASLSLARLPAPATAIAVSADAGVILTASLGATSARLLDGRTGALRATLVGHDVGVSGVALSADGALAATGGDDGRVGLWDGRSGALLRWACGPGTGVGCVALDAAGSRVAWTSQDGLLHVRDVAGSYPERALPGHEAMVNSLSLSADGRLAASAAQDGSVRLWNLDTGEGHVLRRDPWFTGTMAALSADGRRLATTTLADDVVRVLDTESGRELKTLTGHRGGFCGLAINADGSRILTMSPRESAISIWNSETGEMLATLAGHTGDVMALAMSADDRVVISAARDGTVRAWESDLPTERQLAHALERSGP